MTKQLNNFMLPLSLFVLKFILLLLTKGGKNIILSFILSLSLSETLLFYCSLYSLYYIFLILQLSPVLTTEIQAAVFGTKKPSVSPCLGTTPLHTRDGQAVLISLPLNLVHHLHRLRSTGHTSACGFCNMLRIYLFKISDQEQKPVYFAHVGITNPSLPKSLPATSSTNRALI